MRQVSRIAQRAIEKGLSVDEVARDIESMFTGMAKYRAKRIATTEIGIAVSTGDFMAAEASELDLVKVWSNSRDEKVRASHQIREWREISEPFSNGLMYPLDPNGPPSEVVNCRCALLSVPRDELSDWVEV